MVLNLPFPTSSPFASGVYVSWWDPGRHGRVLAVCAVVVTRHRATLEFIAIRGFCLFSQYLSRILYLKSQSTKLIQTPCYSRSVLAKGTFVVMSVVIWIDVPKLLRTGRSGCKKYLHWLSKIVYSLFLGFLYNFSGLKNTAWIMMNVLCFLFHSLLVLPFVFEQEEQNSWAMCHE